MKETTALPPLPASLAGMLADKTFTADRVGQSGAGLYLFEDMVLKIDPDLYMAGREVLNCLQLEGLLPLPRILFSSQEGDLAYTLMSRIKGEMLCRPAFLADPALMADILTKALKTLWQVDTAALRLPDSTDMKLALIRQRLEEGRVDLTDTEADTFGPGGFKDPEDLYLWLERNRPVEDKVLSHGDFCLPNLLAEGDAFSGFVDPGQMGLSDPWQDLALLFRSLEANLHGKYKGKTAYPPFPRGALLTRLGLKPDPEKERYYLLLDELL